MERVRAVRKVEGGSREHGAVEGARDAAGKVVPGSREGLEEGVEVACEVVVEHDLECRFRDILMIIVAL